MVPCGTIWLFTNEAEADSEAAAPFDWGEIQSVDVHGVWIVSWVRSLGVMGEVRVCVL